MLFNNSLKIIQIIKEYYDGETRESYSTCPPKLTKKMLLDELCIIDSYRKSDVYSLQQLWNMYCYMNNNTNSFGLKYSQNYDSERNSIKTSNKKSVTTRSSSRNKKYNIVVTPKRKSTNKNKFIDTSHFYTHKKGNTVRRSVYIGGNQLSKTIEVVEGMNNGTIVPSWHRGWTTLIKLKDVAGTTLFLNGTGIPKDDEDECRSTLLFYKYIKGINRIISLNGCNLQWIRDDGLQVREPKGCGNKEIEIWESICREYNTSVDKKGRMSSTHHPCDYNEYHWIDMDGGYFDVYGALSRMEVSHSQQHTLIHCLGGLGRTGTALLLFICKYYYKDESNKLLFNEHFGMNESDSLEERKRRSYEIMNHLENEIFSKHITFDGNVPDKFIENSNISLVLSDAVRTKIKKDILVSMTVDKMKDEIFTYFYKRFSRGGQISMTCINTFITRINNIIYFTAKINNIEGNITLYNLYGSNNQSIPSLNKGDSLRMKSMVFIYPKTTTVQEIELMMMNNTESTSQGFILSRLPYFSYISDAFVHPSNDYLSTVIEEPENEEEIPVHRVSRSKRLKSIKKVSDCTIS